MSFTIRHSPRGIGIQRMAELKIRLDFQIYPSLSHRLKQSLIFSFFFLFSSNLCLPLFHASIFTNSISLRQTLTRPSIKNRFSNSNPQQGFRLRWKLEKRNNRQSSLKRRGVPGVDRCVGQRSR
ncbi:hypothetical protein ES332_D08G158600v1 [Gossypium tomentosum]|uniref:Uncharacterized protein n=1 Tax=Gossypium tomentosum TaxID=34277 RepID=A0A5D2JUM4_GOSTO|nr:hypothetical protein ES332_D08G158600v1 [Gossypium tomentosum]